MTGLLRRRIGVVVVMVLAVSIVPVSRADADTVAVVAFAATATLNAGIGHMCTDAQLPCPTQPTVVADLPLHGDVIPANFHVEWDRGHNVRTVAVTNIVCADLGFNLNKPGKAPFHAGLCNFGTVNIGKPGTNTLTGYCGFAGGQVVLFVVDALGQTFFLDIHFTVLQTKLYFTGHWYKQSYTFPTQRGKVVGEGTAVPNAPNESCLDKTLKNFLLEGEAVLFSTPL